MIVNGLHYKRFCYKEVLWEANKVLKYSVYTSFEDYEMERKCFLLSKQHAKVIKEYHPYCYDTESNETIKENGKEKKMTICHMFYGDLDYDYYEKR